MCQQYPHPNTTPSQESLNHASNSSSSRQQQNSTSLRQRQWQRQLQRQRSSNKETAAAAAKKQQQQQQQQQLGTEKRSGGKGGVEPAKGGRYIFDISDVRRRATASFRVRTCCSSACKLATCDSNSSHNSANSRLAARRSKSHMLDVGDHSKLSCRFFYNVFLEPRKTTLNFEPQCHLENNIRLVCLHLGLGSSK